MNIVRPQIQKTKAGSCPHGMPPGACPICSGGGGSTSKNKPRRAGELSWNECYAIGQLMKAQQLAQKQKKSSMNAQILLQEEILNKLEILTQKIGAVSEKLTDFIQNAKNNPTLITKTLTLAAKIALPLVNILKSVPVIIQKTIIFVQEKFTDISDKLNAIFGELKASIEKKFSDKFNNFKKKIKSIFGLFETLNKEELSEEEKVIEESKRIFNLKNTINNIQKHFRKKENKE